MIYGIGIDLVSVERIEAAVASWGERFLRRVFTEKEIAYSYKKKNPYPSLSARFAAKEACIKALRTERAISLTDIEIVQEGEKPSLRLRGGAEQLCREHGVCSAHVSLTHEKEYSIACVVLERAD